MKRAIKLKEKTALKEIERKLIKGSFRNDTCVVCCDNLEYGYMGKNLSCKQQHNNKPSACNLCII